MDGDQRLLVEIGEVYESAITPSRWQSFLKLYAQRYPDAGIYLWLQSYDNTVVNFADFCGGDPEMLIAYQDYYVKVNPWPDIMLKKPEGFVGTTDTLIPDNEVVKTEWYADWLRPQGFHTAFGSNLLKTDKHVFHFSTVLPHGRETTREDIRVMAALTPHMQRAARLHFEFSKINQKSALIEATLDLLPMGCILLDHLQRLIFANKLAQEIFLASDGISFEKGSLMASPFAKDVALQKLLYETGSVANGTKIINNKSLVIKRPSGKPPYVVHVVPLSSRTESIFDDFGMLGPALAVFISDPTVDQKTQPDLLRQLFGLTPAECRFAISFLATTSISQSADACGLTKGSARVVLKRVMEKVGAKSQGEVVKKILLACAGKPM